MNGRPAKTRKILVVSLSQTPYAGLAGLGHTIVFAGTTVEALTKAAEEEPDLIVIEGRLQFIKGSWNKKYGEKGKAPPPVLLVCTPGQVLTQLNNFDLPVTDHLLEGFVPEDLHARAGLLLSRRRLDLTVMRDNFIDIMVYDIRAPLASILVGLEFLLANPNDLNPVQKKVVQTLFYGCTDLKGLLENFLDLERMDAEPSAPKKTKLDARSFLEEVVEIVKPMLAFREVQLRLEPAPNLAPLWADAPLLKKGLLNLLISTGKLSDPGTAVMLRAKPNEDGHYFEIENQSHAIPAEARENIFDRYYHRGKGGWIFPRGFGTSLSYAHRIIDGHGGRIWVEANAPAGNRFHIILPHVS